MGRAVEVPRARVAFSADTSRGGWLVCMSILVVVVGEGRSRRRYAVVQEQGSALITL